MPRKSFLYAAPLPLLLSACMGSDCTQDPRYAGLGTAANCIANGGFERETDRLAADADQKTRLAAELRAENQQLRNQLASLNARERTLANRLIGVNDEIALLERGLSQRLQRQQIGQAEYDLGVSQLQDLTAQRRNVTPTDPQAEAKIAQLEAEIAELKRFLS